MNHRKQLVRGDDYTFIVHITDNGLPRDLTGLQEVCYQVFESVREEKLLYEAKVDNGIVIPDMLDGKIYIHFPWHVSENNPAVQLYHKCKIIDQSDRRTTVLSDYIDFYKNNLAID